MAQPSPLAERFYRVVRLRRPGLVLVAHPVYGEQHWRLGKIRGATRACAECDACLVPSTAAWRPMTHAGNRKERICAECMERMVEARI
jgi:hypothetical protein